MEFFQKMVESLQNLNEDFVEELFNYLLAPYPSCEIVKGTKCYDGEIHLVSCSASLDKESDATLFQEALDRMNQQVLLAFDIPSLGEPSAYNSRECSDNIHSINFPACNWNTLGQNPHEGDPILKNLGDPTCYYNAHSPLLKCGVSPDNECSECPNYRKQEEP